MIKDKIKGGIYALISGIAFGFLGYFGIELIKDGMSVNLMLMYRNICAALFFLPFFLNNRHQIKEYSQKSLLRIFVINSLFFSGSSYFFFMACKYIGLGLAITIFFCYPAILLLILVLFDRHKITALMISCIIMVITGCYLIYNLGDPNSRYDEMGVYYAIAGAFCYAMYVFLGKRDVKNFNTKDLTFILCIGNVIIFFILSLVTDELKPFIFNYENTINILSIGLLCTAMPILFLLESIKYISSAKAAIISVIEPAVSVLVGIFLLNESFTYVQIIGVLTILLSSLIIQIEK